MTPIRIQLSRRKGFRLPAGTVVVSRPGRWGNPFKVGDVQDGILTMSPEHAVRRFEEWLTSTPAGHQLAQDARSQLRGRDLACWCRLGLPCHADTLLRTANSAGK